MQTTDDNDVFRAAAAASKKRLESLLKERDQLQQRLNEINQPISMLQHVVAAWQQLDPNASVQVPLIPPSETATNITHHIARGMVTDKVFEIMSDKQPRTAQQVQQEIGTRYNINPSINAVSVALRRGKERGTMGQTARGEYVLL